MSGNTVGLRLRGAVPNDFQRFYRLHLRRSVGSRISSSDLRRRYHDWVAEAGGESIGFKQLRRAMERIGHRHLHSDGVWYLDVQFAELVPDLADNLPSEAPRPGEGLVADLHDRIQAVAAELDAIRGLAAAAGIMRLSA